MTSPTTPISNCKYYATSLLPDLVFREIFKHFSWSEKLVLETVCKDWYNRMIYDNIGFLNLPEVIGFKKRGNFEVLESTLSSANDSRTFTVIKPSILEKLLTCLLFKSNAKITGIGCSIRRQSLSPASHYVMSRVTVNLLIDHAKDYFVRLELKQCLIPIQAFNLIKNLSSLRWLSMPSTCVLVQNYTNDGRCRILKTNCLPISAVALRWLPKLTVLKCGGFAPEILPPHIVELELESTNVSRLAESLVDPVPALECLDLSSVDHVTPLLAQLDLFSGLRHLKLLMRSEEIVDMNNICTDHFKSQLVTLSIEKRYGSGSVGVDRIAMMEVLETLRLINFSDLRQESFLALISTNAGRRIRSLTLRNCWSLNQDSLYGVAVHCPNIETMDFVLNTVLGERPEMECLSKLLENCTKLTRACFRVGELNDPFLRLLVSTRNLRYVELQEVSMTEHSLELLHHAAKEVSPGRVDGLTIKVIYGGGTRDEEMISDLLNYNVILEADNFPETTTALAV